MVSTLEQWLFLSGPEDGGDTLRNSCKGCATELSKFPRGHSRIKVTGMLIGKFKLNPGGPMWVWLKLNPSSKGDFCVVSVRAFFVNFFAIPEWARIVTFHPKHVSETEICNLQPKVKQRASPSLLYGSPLPGPNPDPASGQNIPFSAPCFCLYAYKIHTRF